MAVRPPSDAVVALRSLPRRFRALFSGLGDDESPEALAARSGADGRSASDHLDAALNALGSGEQGLDLALGAAGTVSGWEAHTLDERLDELTRIAGAFADRADRVSADEWASSGAAAALWAAVDGAVEELKAAERTLAEVRGRP